MEDLSSLWRGLTMSDVFRVDPANLSSRVAGWGLRLVSGGAPGTLNGLVDRLPTATRDGLRHIDLLVLRPSQDLGRLANEFEIELPRGFRFLVRGLGSRETRSNDMLSLLMFQQDYIARLIALGEADARARAAEIDAFMSNEWPAAGADSSHSELEKIV